MFRNKILSPAEALTRAAAYCSKAERAPEDVRGKLLQWGVGKNEAESIIERLMDENFLNEERYIRAFIHDKCEYDHWGRIKIRYALKYKQLNETIIDRLIAESIDEERYLEKLVGILTAKSRNLPRPLTAETRAKLYRFATQRGYETAHISRALARISDSPFPEEEH